MFYRIKNQIDILLLSLSIAAVLLGLMLLYSAGNLSWHLPFRQLMKGSISILFIVPLFFLSDRNIRDLAIPIYLFNVLLLVFVLYYGYTAKGAQRWLFLFGIRFEPSEIIKLTLPIALASLIHKRGIPLRHSSLLIGVVMIMIPFALILKQPDLGTALILFTLGGITLFIAGLNRKLILWGMLAVSILSPILWQGLHPYQKQRIITLISPQEDLQHHGYHIYQAKAAIGSGGLFGKGFGQGSQVQLGYIPEHKTDFIFTVLSEEFGFMGCLLWFSILLGIGFRSIYLGYSQQQLFNKLSVVMLGVNLMLNAWINMAMVAGLLPVVGIPLPFLSYGATNFTIALINSALILKLGHPDPRRQYVW